MDFSALEKQYNLPAGILGRMEQVESGGNQFALSNKGAQGYFQFLPGTAKQYNVDPYNLNSAAQGAAHYLADLYKQTGSMEKAVAAYNWGLGNLEKQGYQNAPPETRAYVRKVMGADTAKSNVINAQDALALLDGAPTQTNPPLPARQAAASGNTLNAADAAKLLGWSQNQDTNAGSPEETPQTAPKPPAATEQPWYSKAMDMYGNALKGAGKEALSVLGGASVPLWNAIGTIPYKPIQDFASKEARTAGSIGSPVTNAIGQGATMALAGAGAVPEMAGGVVGRIAGSGALGGVLSGLAAPVGEKLHAANVGALAGGTLGATGEAALAAGPALKSGYQYLAHPELNAGAKGARAMASDLASKVPAPMARPAVPEMPVKPQPFAQVPPDTAAPPPSKMQVNADLRKLFEKRGTALDAERTAIGTQLQSVAKGLDTSKQEEAISRLNQEIKDLQTKQAQYKHTAAFARTGVVPKEFSTAIAARQAELAKLTKDLRGAVGETPKETVQKIIDNIGNRIPHEGSEAARNELSRIQKNLTYVRDNTPNKIQALIDLRREVSERAKFGEPMKGADLLGPKQSRELSNVINDALDKHLSAYGDLRAQYKDILDKQHPLEAGFFKNVGADETLGTDEAARILSSPENLQKAKDALGGNTADLDRLLAKKVQADLSGKSAQDVRQYINEREPVLKTLPEATKTADRALSRAEAADALKAIQKKQQDLFQRRMDVYNKTLGQQTSELEARQAAWAASHKLAQTYATDFTQLGAAKPAQLPARLRSVLNRMANPQEGGAPPLITQAELKDALAKVNVLEKQIQRQQTIRNYAIKLGVPALAVYAFRRQAWDIIMHLIK